MILFTYGQVYIWFSGERYTVEIQTVHLYVTPSPLKLKSKWSTCMIMPSDFFYSAISWREQISYFLMRWWRNLFCIKPPHRRCRLHERRRIYLSWHFYCAWFTTILGHKGQHIHIIGISLINHTIICKCIFILPFDICHQI